jgi:hypothetical protein
MPKLSSIHNQESFLCRSASSPVRLPDSFCCDIRTHFTAFDDSQSGVFAMLFTFLNLHSDARMPSFLFAFSSIHDGTSSGCESLSSICFPHRAGVIREYCFHHCLPLLTVTFESPSRCSRIELEGFPCSAVSPICQAR